MDAIRPVLPQILYITVGWFALATMVVVGLIYLATRGQSRLGKLLCTLGFLCFLALPAFIALKFVLIGWYGGTPDAAASHDGSFYVREKVRLYRVSENEYRRLQRVHRNDTWFVSPCLAGVAFVALAHLVRPQSHASGAAAD